MASSIISAKITLNENVIQVAMLENEHLDVNDGK